MSLSQDARQGKRVAERVWLAATLAGAVLVTAVDALLLQQKKAFFTGGFLASSQRKGPLEILSFIGVSLCADAALIGLLAAVALVLISRLRLAPRARALSAFLAGVAPLLVADFAAYRLASYLGDAFNVSLLWELSGRKPQEFAAVASGHLAAPVLIMSAAAGAAGGLIWVVHRANRRHASPLPGTLPLLGRAAILAACAVMLVAAASARSEMLADGVGRKPSGQFDQWASGRLTDVDGDGFGIGASPADPDPFNGAIYPYAVDVPGNGVDEDGVGGDLPDAGAPYTEGAPHRVWQRHPNVILIVLESFRADALGRSVNGTPVTPVLDALGRSGISAPVALSHNGYTAQSRFHIFSGSLAGLRGGTSLIDDFKTNGYEVGYFSGQDDSFGGEAYSVGMYRADIAYDARQDRRRRYTSYTTAGSLAVPFDVVQERIRSFMEHRDRSRPLFLYVNFHDTHYPYHRPGLRSIVSAETLTEPDISFANGARLKEMYFNTAANVDAAIGATLDMVGRNLGSPPAVIATADHGESLFDEGFLGHGYALNDVQTRIPLVVAGLPLRVEEPFGQSDLRDAIGAALAEPAGPDAPRVESCPDKRVFQYLGRIERPRQIAFANGRTRTIYDFRRRGVQFAGGAWVHPEQLAGLQKDEFLRLIALWERMVGARAAGSSASARQAPVPGRE